MLYRPRKQNLIPSQPSPEALPPGILQPQNPGENALPPPAGQDIGTPLLTRGSAGTELPHLELNPALQAKPIYGPLPSNALR